MDNSGRIGRILKDKSFSKDKIMPRTISIGNQTFSNLIENNCFYVDKTPFIKEWWEGESTVTLITRPRNI